MRPTHKKHLRVTGGHRLWSRLLRNDDRRHLGGAIVAEQRNAGRIGGAIRRILVDAIAAVAATVVRQTTAVVLRHGCGSDKRAQ